MIDYIQFKDPKSIDPKTFLAEDPSYIPFIPSLIGRRFDFNRGLNVVVGPNAVGKTSLLSAIRRLCFAESDTDGVEICSKFLFTQFFNISFARHFDEGLYELVDMKADYSKPIFSLRKAMEIGQGGPLSSPFSLLQTMESREMSGGENVSYALHALIAVMQGKMPGIKASEYMNFGKILSCLAEHADKSFRKSTASWAKFGLQKAEYVMDWFKRNDIGRREHLTAVLDEPDEGMDIYRLNSLYALLRAVAQLRRDQFIVTLHNVALVNALSSLPEVNVIEMSPGYHRAMLDFGKVEDIGEPPDQDDEGKNDAWEAFRVALVEKDAPPPPSPCPERWEQEPSASRYSSQSDNGWSYLSADAT